MSLGLEPAVLAAQEVEVARVDEFPSRCLTVTATISHQGLTGETASHSEGETVHCRGSTVEVEAISL